MKEPIQIRSTLYRSSMKTRSKVFYSSYMRCGTGTIRRRWWTKVKVTAGVLNELDTDSETAELNVPAIIESPFR